MKKIFFVIPYFDSRYQFYGALRYIVELAEALKNKGIEVEIHTSSSKGFSLTHSGLRWNRDNDMRESIKGIEIIKYPVTGIDLNPFIKQSLARLVKLFTSMSGKSVGQKPFEELGKSEEKELWKYVDDLFRASRETNNIIHEANLLKIGPQIDYDMIAEKAKKEKVKIIVAYSPFATLYGIHKACSKIQYPYSVLSFFHAYEKSHYNELTFKALKEAEQIYCLTPFEVDLWHKHLGIDKSKLKLVYAGTKPPVVTRIEKNRNIFKTIFISRPEERKNLCEFIAIAEALKKEINNLQILLISAEPINIPLPTYVKALVKISDDERDKEIINADCIIFPSISESFGLVMLEGLKFKVPVFVSKNNLASASVMSKINPKYIYKNKKELLTNIYELYSNNLSNITVNVNINRIFFWDYIANLFAQ